MKTRNLSKLVETKEFQELIKKFPIKHLIINGNLLLKNDCVYMYMYSYMVEDIIYCHLFDVKNKNYCFNIDRIAVDMIGEIYLGQIHANYKKEHTISIINEKIPGEISVENDFLARIEILKKYFPDLLEGKIEQYKNYFEPLRGGYINMFNELKSFVEKQG